MALHHDFTRIVWMIWLTAALSTSCTPTDTGDNDGSGNNPDAVHDTRDMPDISTDSDAESNEFEETDEDRAAVDAERATPEQIGLHIPIDDSLSTYDEATVRYRKQGGSTWREAHPLVHIRPSWITDNPAPPETPVEAFAGTIFGLEPGTTYEVAITLEERDTADETIFRRILSTRALPPPASEPTVTASPQDDLQSKINGLKPGDILQLQEGTHEVDGLTVGVSGTENEPIYIRGASREQTIIEDSSGRVIRTDNTAHLVVEHLTIRGSGSDSGTSASSRGISLDGGEGSQFITVRGVDIVGVDMGIVASGPLRSTLVYNNVLRGNNEWNEEFVGQKSWNDDGIRLPGSGNCAFENTLDGFGDSFAVQNGEVSTAVHFYRNDVNASGDDAFEGDYSTRNVSFYDNYITNTARVLSLDPLWGGPLYDFRNIVINTAAGPPKFNSTGSGFLVYNNTYVRTEGITDWAYVQYAKGPLRNFSYRNNVLIYRGPSDNLLAFEPSGIDPVDWTHNAWYPDGSVWWTNSGGTFGSIDEARQGLPETTPAFGQSTARHKDDVIATSSPFTDQTDPSLGNDYTTEVRHDAPPTPADSSAIRNAGTPIPNITDGYDGPAPDMGAVIRGRPTLDHGADR